MRYEDLPLGKRQEIENYLKQKYLAFEQAMLADGTPIVANSFQDYLVVGSYAGGHATEESDLDVLIYFSISNWAPMEIVKNDVYLARDYLVQSDVEQSSLGIRIDCNFCSEGQLFYPLWHSGDVTKRLAYGITSKESFVSKDQIASFYAN